MSNIAELAGRLSKAQRRLLLSLQPTLDDQPITERQFWDSPPLCVEHRPAQYEDGILVDPGDRTWFAGSSGTFFNGQSTCRIALNKTGLALRAHAATKGETDDR